MSQLTTRAGAGPLVGAAVIASLVAGIPAGLIARLAMARLGELGGDSLMARIGEFTLGGTLRIMVVPMIFGIPFAVLLLAIGRRWRAGPLVLRILAYAIGALILPGLLFFTDSEFSIAGANAMYGRWLFVPVFLVYGAGVGAVGEWLLYRREAR